MNKREKIISAIEKAKKQSEENALDKIIIPFKEADIIISLLKQQEQKLICPKCNGQPKGVICGLCGQAVSLE